MAAQAVVGVAVFAESSSSRWFRTPHDPGRSGVVTLIRDKVRRTDPVYLVVAAISVVLVILLVVLLF